MRIQPKVLEFCLGEYHKLKSELVSEEQVSEFDIDYEFRFTIFLAAQIDGIQKPIEREFFKAISTELGWSPVYDSLLLGKIEKQPSYELRDIAIGKRFEKMGEIFYKTAYCMVLIDNEFNTDEKFFMQNLKDHLFGSAISSIANLALSEIVDLDGGSTSGLDVKKIKEEALKAAEQSVEEKTLTKEECLELLNQLVGLKTMKEEVKQLVSFLEIQTKRKEHNLSLSQPALHMVFTGAPGTGKTTVARIIAKIYASLGILKKGHLIETDRSGLVGQYMGHTDAKTTEVINSALDGVLFIDEAYSLSKDSENDFGQEAIDTLVKRMEDDRGRLIVIVAGYGEEMNTFIESNPGLRSRFNTNVHFENFTAPELLEIFQGMCNKNDYTVGKKSQEKLLSIFEIETKDNRDDFGNGRYIRNLFEKVLRNQAMRLNSSKKELSRKDLMQINPADIIQVQSHD